MTRANAVFLVTPDGRPVGQGTMSGGVFVPAPPAMPPMAPPMMARPPMFGRGPSGLPELIDLVQAGSTLIWARPASVTPPPDSADPIVAQRNQVLYTAAVASTTLDAKRNEVLISESARALRAVVGYAEKRRAMGMPLLGGY